jgi:hypothetical protein
MPMRNVELYPQLQQNRELVKRLTGFFAVQPQTYEIAVFGALAADTADRWSAVDLIVVTAHTEDQPTLFATLRDHHTVIYHRPFMRDPNGPGAYVYGVLLAGVSPFHLVNLHFLTLTERNQPEIRSRYYGIRRLHQMIVAPSPTPAQATTLPAEAETVEEARVYDATNSLRRALRQVLQQHSRPDTLNAPRTQLETILASHPNGIPSLHGDVCVLAQHYLKMTAIALRAEHETHD